MPRELSRPDLIIEVEKRRNKAERANSKRVQEHLDYVNKQARQLAEWYLNPSNGATKDQIIEDLERHGCKPWGGIKTLKKEVLAADVAKVIMIEKYGKWPTDKPNPWVYFVSVGLGVIKKAAVAEDGLREYFPTWVGADYPDRGLIRAAETMLIEHTEANHWFDVFYLWVENDRQPTFLQAVEYVLRYNLQRGGSHHGLHSDAEKALAREGFFRFSHEAARALPPMEVFDSV